MRKVIYKVAFLLVAVLLTSNFIFSSIILKTYTGRVGDAMCGVKHQIGGSVECTRICVQRGSKYDLIIGNQAYMLDTKDKAVLEKLDSLAAKTALIKGVMENNMIEVRSVTAAK